MPSGLAGRPYGESSAAWPTMGVPAFCAPGSLSMLQGSNVLAFWLSSCAACAASCSRALRSASCTAAMRSLSVMALSSASVGHLTVSIGASSGGRLSYHALPCCEG